MKRLVFTLILVLGLSAIGCQKEPRETHVESITISASSVTIDEGETYTLTATVSPDNASNKKILWTTSDASIASVDNGKVSAIKEGKATITSKSDDGGKTATCQITVNKKIVAVSGVSLDKECIELSIGDETTLSATVAPDNATNKNVTWLSSDETVASVDNGKVKASKEGKTTITVKTDDGGKTAYCEVTVKEKTYPVESVLLDKTSLELTEGDEYTLTATVKPDNATDKSISWKSSDEAIALVTDGKVKALKKGNAIITVTTSDGNKTASCSVNVNEKIIHVESVSLDKTSITLTAGEEATLIATVLPENSSDKRVEWSSNNEECVSVTDGTIKAIKAGTATITAKSVDGGIEATCSVTINPEEYPLIKKISYSSFITASFTYDTYKRITRAEGKYKGKGYEITLNYDDYSDGNGTIIMNAFYGDELLTMKDGLCVYKSDGQTYEYENNHLIRWDQEYDFYWDGNLLTGTGYHYSDKDIKIRPIEYGTEDNPFVSQQFNITYFILDGLSMDFSFLFGLCGPEPDKLMTKVGSYDTLSYEYKNGVITRIYIYFDDPSENTKETDIITIEYY